LTEKIDKPKRGRPAVGGSTVIRLSPETRARIEKIAGPNQMAAFIREAVEAELRRREKAR